VGSLGSLGGVLVTLQKQNLRGIRSIQQASVCQETRRQVFLHEENQEVLGSDPVSKKNTTKINNNKNAKPRKRNVLTSVMEMTVSYMH